jgi:hypothetical protein
MIILFIKIKKRLLLFYAGLICLNLLGLVHITFMKPSGYFFQTQYGFEYPQNAKNHNYFWFMKLYHECHAFDLSPQDYQLVLNKIRQSNEKNTDIRTNLIYLLKDQNVAHEIMSGLNRRFIDNIKPYEGLLQFRELESTYYHVSKEQINMIYYDLGQQRVYLFCRNQEFATIKMYLYFLRSLINESA